MPWQSLPLDQPFWAGLDELALTRAAATLENAYVDEGQGQTSFPDLVPFVTLGGGGRVYCRAYPGGVIATTSGGRTFGLDAAGAHELDGVPLAVRGRPTFDDTFDGLLMAAGGQILASDGASTRVLSPEAPEVTHVCFLKDYVLGLIADTGEIAYANPGFYDQWPTLNTFRDDNKPDKSTAILVNQYNELFVFGRASCELYSLSANADQPFYLRSQVGEGLFAPGLLVEGRQKIWGVTAKRQVCAFTLAGGQPADAAIDRLLQRAGDWTDAWMGYLPWGGRRFVVLQLPRLAGPDGSEGVTFAMDEDGGKWSLLSAWDGARHRPARWPVWSIAQGRDGTVYLGGDDGVVYRASASRDPAAVPRRYRFRSAPYAASGIVRGASSVEVTDVRVALVRRYRVEDADDVVPPTLRLRCRVGLEPWNEWLEEPIDSDPESAEAELVVEYGAQGSGSTVQVEMESFAGAPLDLRSIQVDARGHGR